MNSAPGNEQAEPGAARTAPGRMNESALIRAIMDALPAGPNSLIVGPGDDAAVYAPPPGDLLLSTIDTLAEGVHFERSWMPPFSLGRKAVAQGLSDVAAMGGRPLFLVCSLSMSREVSKSFFDGFMGGLISACNEYRCALAGGNLARCESGISVTTAVTGCIRPGAALLRSSARPGHSVWVTGKPGLAAVGLEAVRGGSADGSRAAKRFLDPVPRIREAAFLRDSGGAAAAIDLSDGLRRCASILSRESRVGVEIDAEALPVASPGGDLRVPLRLALDGGEDFELLFTAPAGSVEKVAGRFVGKFGVELTKIGRVLDGDGLTVLGDPGPGPEFEHFI